MADAQDGQMLEGLLFALLQIEASRLAPGQVLLVSRAVEDPHTIQWVVSAMNKTAKVEPPTFAAGGEADGLPSWAAAIADQILAGLAALGQTVAGVAQWLAEMVRSFLGAVGKTVMEVLGVEEKPEHPHGLATAAARTVVLIVMIAVVQHRKHLMP
uniref:182389m n=1 Tax=Chlamydomonas reinhardtii TaxID=3055 RepID=D5LAZ1_CHLRE|nr:182389m [Chlamydomonas reinhardtii]